MFRKAVAVLLLTLFTSACAQQAVFLSDPPGARVLVDGEEIGVTPCAYRYSNSAGSSYEVTVEKEGFEALRHTVEADEWDAEARNVLLTTGAVLPGGSALLLGALFTRKLKDNYEFVLRQASPPQTARAGEAAPEPRF